MRLLTGIVLRLTSVLALGILVVVVASEMVKRAAELMNEPSVVWLAAGGLLTLLAGLGVLAALLLLVLSLRDLGRFIQKEME